MEKLLHREKMQNIFRYNLPTCTSVPRRLIKGDLYLYLYEVVNTKLYPHIILMVDQSDGPEAHQIKFARIESWDKNYAHLQWWDRNKQMWEKDLCHISMHISDNHGMIKLLSAYDDEQQLIKAVNKNLEWRRAFFG